MTPETERLHQLNAELTAQRDEARAERDKITSDYNLLAIELIDAHTSLAQAAAERDKAQADVERLNAAIPSRCPITNLEFFGLIEHPDLGWVATYGGPYDSYTIPEVEDAGKGTPLHEMGLSRWRYCHDRGCWVEAETIDLRLIKEADLIEVHDELDAKLRERTQAHRERAGRIFVRRAAGLDRGEG